MTTLLTAPSYRLTVKSRDGKQVFHDKIYPNHDQAFEAGLKWVMEQDLVVTIGLSDAANVDHTNGGNHA